MITRGWIDGQEACGPAMGDVLLSDCWGLRSLDIIL